jgi:CPA2 family monovalent cation:H+ antiporter-2
VAVVTAIVIGAARSSRAVAEFLSRELDVSRTAAHAGVLITAILFSVPFLGGLFRVSRRLAAALGAAALPKAADGKTDLAAAPRRALIATLQLGIVLLVGLPFVALTQPFLPSGVAAAALAIVIGLYALAFWRSALNLEGHVKAGADVIVEALVAHARKRDTPDEEALAEIKNLVPGIGEPVPLRLGARSIAVGRTLAELNLRALTGASVLAIARGSEGVIVPKADEVLRADDVLAIAGTRDAVAAASDLLAAETWNLIAANNPIAAH